MTLFDYLKNFLFLLIILQIAPTLIEKIKKQYISILEPKTKIGLLTCKGTLYDSSFYVKALNTFFKDASIKGILIKMECPGSASGTGQTIHNELKSLKARYPKPVGVVVENVCASGGYYIATAADYIVAPGMALIGGIGTGAYKNATDPLVDICEQDKKLPQELLDDAYQQCIADVAANRHLARTQSCVWAEGKLFSGKQAQELGLIDIVGSPCQAVEIMKKRALIDGEIEYVQESQATGILSWFCSHEQDAESLSTSIMDSLCTYFEHTCSPKKHC